MRELVSTPVALRGWGQRVCKWGLPLEERHSKQRLYIRLRRGDAAGGRLYMRGVSGVGEEGGRRSR